MIFWLIQRVLCSGAVAQPQPTLTALHRKTSELKSTANSAAGTALSILSLQQQTHQLPHTSNAMTFSHNHNGDDDFSSSYSYDRSSSFAHSGHSSSTGSASHDPVEAELSGISTSVLILIIAGCVLFVLVLLLIAFATTKVCKRLSSNKKQQPVIYAPRGQYPANAHIIVVPEGYQGGLSQPPQMILGGHQRQQTL